MEYVLYKSSDLVNFIDFSISNSEGDIFTFLNKSSFVEGAENKYFIDLADPSLKFEKVNKDLVAKAGDMYIDD